MSFWNFYCCLCVVSGVLLLDNHACGELIWEKTIHAVKVERGVKEEQAVFRFRNNGSKPVLIKKIQTSCGCTNVASDKTKYEAGEQGAITAVFKFGNRQGTQEKSIRIETNEPTSPSHTLLIRVDLPTLVSVNKRALSWEIGDPLERQSFSIFSTQSIKIERFEILRGFKGDLEEIKIGKKFEINITPKSTSKPATGSVIVIVKIGNRNHRETLELFVQ